MAKIKKSIGHDRLSLSAKFPTGAELRFSISRLGERLMVAFSNDKKEGDMQMQSLRSWLEFRDGETNLDRINRLAELVKGCKSGKEVIEKINK
jgi:hypothetical protein